jgi:hypothetical protein
MSALTTPAKPRLSRAEAARANGANSKGPKTAQGKAKSSQNALKHGLTAKWLTLPGEDVEAYLEFHEGVCTDLKPMGFLEQVLADRIVQCLWRLRNFLRIESAMVKRENFTTSSPRLYFNSHIWPQAYASLSRYEANLDRSRIRATKELRELQAARKQESQNEPTNSGPHEPLSTPVERGRGEARQPNNHHEAVNQSSIEKLQNEPNEPPYIYEDHFIRPPESPEFVNDNSSIVNHQNEPNDPIPRTKNPAPCPPIELSDEAADERFDLEYEAALTPQQQHAAACRLLDHYLR